MTLAAPLARALERIGGKTMPHMNTWAVPVLAALRNDPETLAALAEALHDRYGAALCLAPDEQWTEDGRLVWAACPAQRQWQDEAAALADRLFGAASDQQVSKP